MSAITARASKIEFLRKVAGMGQQGEPAGWWIAAVKKTKVTLLTEYGVFGFHEKKAAEITLKMVSQAHPSMCLSLVPASVDDMISAEKPRR